MINEIIDTLLSERNIFDFIQLSKKYSEIDLNDYLNYIPSININYDWLEHEKKSDGYKSFPIYVLETFKLKGNKELFTNKSLFLQNIPDVCEITFIKPYNKNYTFIVENGIYNASFSENFFSIEFSLNNLNGPAIISDDEKFYCIDEKLMSKELHQNIMRKIKINKLTNQPYQSPKELVKIKVEKSRTKYIEKRKEKEKKKNKEIIYDTFNLDSDDNFVYSAC